MTRPIPRRREPSGAQIIVSFNGRTVCLDRIGSLAGHPTALERGDVDDDSQILVNHSASHRRRDGGAVGSSIGAATIVALAARKMSISSTLADKLEVCSTVNGRLVRLEQAGWGDWVSLRVRDFRLLGGKGGFGAALRASAKRKGGKVTTDFGACRDLNGRRLRHVNNEARLRVWREEKEEAARAGQEWDLSKSKMLDTKSGVAGWFLDVPTWADPIPKNAAAGAFLSGEHGDKIDGKPHRGRDGKNQLCKNWMRAREGSGSSRVPENAPAWWGCPRGSFCRFAHGHSELTDEGKKMVADENRRDKISKEASLIQEYVADNVQRKNAIASSIMRGMQRSKVDALDSKRGNAIENCSVPDSSQDETVGTPQDSYLRCVCGDVAIGETGEVQGLSSFATVAIPSVAVTSGTWYFEVEVLENPSETSQGKSSGCSGNKSSDSDDQPSALQIGCANEQFEPDELTNDGAGDKPGSWAFDPFRSKLFIQGEEVDVEIAASVKSGSRSKFTPVVGCLVDLKSKELAFFLNGSKVSLPGERPLRLDSPSASSSRPASLFFPTFSLEQARLIRVNLGEKSFIYRPSSSTPVRGLAGDGGLGCMLNAVAQKRTLDTDMQHFGSESRFLSQNVKSQAAEALAQPMKIDLAEYGTPEELEKLGLGALKQQLSLRGLKCGGDLKQRAERLFSIKGLASGDYDHLRPKAKKRKT